MVSSLTLCLIAAASIVCAVRAVEGECWSPEMEQLTRASLPQLGPILTELCETLNITLSEEWKQSLRDMPQVSHVFSWLLFLSPLDFILFCPSARSSGDPSGFFVRPNGGRRLLF